MRRTTIFVKLAVACAVTLTLAAAAHAQCRLVKLLQSDIPIPTVTQNPEFGNSVSISGDIIVVGARHANGAEYRSGAAYIFKRDTNDPLQWVFVKKIFASDGRNGDDFGRSATVNGDSIIVGAPFDQSVVGYVGSAYIFERNAGGADNWGEVKKLEDPAPGNLAEFGYSVAIAGDWAIVGGPGTAGVFFYQRDQGGAGNWGFVQDFSNPQDFGYAMDLDGDDLLIVGAPDRTPANLGQAYVYTRSGTTWSLDDTFTSSETGARFGESVAIEDHGSFVRSVIGAPDDSNGGSIHIHEEYIGPDFDLTRRGDDTDVTDAYGTSVAMDGDTIVVGATMDDDYNFNAGAMYVHQRSEGGADNWGQTGKYTPYDATVASGGIQSGGAVAIEADTMLYASHLETAPNGAAYVGTVYMLSTTEPDCNNNGFCDAADIESMTSDDVNGNGIPDECECLGDITGDASNEHPNNVVNLFDLLLLLDNWGTSGDGADIAAPLDKVDLFDLLAMLDHWGPC